MFPRVLVVTAAVVVGIGCAIAAQQAAPEQAAALSRRATERLQALHEEADRLAAEERTVLGDLRKLELDSQISATELERAREAVRSASAVSAALDLQVETLTAEVQAAEPDLRARLVTLYKLGRGQYARLLLSAADLRQLGQAVRLVSALAEQDRQRMVRQQQRLTDLTAAREEARQRQEEVRRLAATAEAAQVSAERALARHSALVRDIDTRRDLNARYASELMAAEQRLQASLAGLSTAAPAALPLDPFKGALSWPVPGEVRHRFGYSAAGRPPLRGIELESENGTAVHAIHEGTVAFAGSFTGYGRLVIVDHGGQTFSLYGNLADVSVQRGARIEQGAVIGAVGGTGEVAPSMYFELRVDGRAVDPLQWLTKR